LGGRTKPCIALCENGKEQSFFSGGGGNKVLISTRPLKFAHPGPNLIFDRLWSTRSGDRGAFTMASFFRGTFGKLEASHSRGVGFGIENHPGGAGAKLGNCNPLTRRAGKTRKAAGKKILELIKPPGPAFLPENKKHWGQNRENARIWAFWRKASRVWKATFPAPAQFLVCGRGNQHKLPSVPG